MRELARFTNPYGDDKAIDACGIFAAMSRRGRKISGSSVIEAMANMHERGNGLGGGYAVYGIYPEYRDYYALHLMFETAAAKEETEAFLRRQLKVVDDEEIPTRAHPRVKAPPILWRYFARPEEHSPGGMPDDDYVVEQVMHINTRVPGAFVFSSGKDMGVFKGVGHTEDIGRFFCLEEYEGYLWTAHSRFPTNTTAWWGGAHPFSILDWTVIHNGEISSYGTNRNFLEMHGYFCTMHTDTEVMAYAVDLLVRRHHLPIDLVAKVLAPPLWGEIDRLPPEERELCATLRIVYGSLLMNGPFTVVLAHAGEMIGLGDRIRLRPLVAATRGDVQYLASEEAPIRLVEPDLDRVWIPRGGEPVVCRLETESPALANLGGRV